MAAGPVHLAKHRTIHHVKQQSPRRRCGRGDLQAKGEGVGQAHGAREGRQQQVAHLDAAGRHAVAEPEVILAEQLREVVQQDQQHPQRALRVHMAP